MSTTLKTTAARVLAEARKHIGYNGTGTEDEPLSDFGAWYGINPGQWCGMFVSFVFDTAGDGTVRFAYCPDGVAHFQSGAWGTWHDKNEPLLPGDVIFWDYGLGRPSHVGICEVGGNSASLITSIQGNTTDSTIGRTGNCCRRKQHYRGYMVGFGRPHYGAGGSVSTALDYSAGVPSAAAIKAAGHSGVIRYLKKQGSSSVRVLTANEYAEMKAGGVGVALVYEATSASRAGQGREAGVSDATWALQQARAVGIEPRCIYLAVDFDASVGAVTSYFQGAHSVLGSRTGVYGGRAVVEGLRAAGLASWLWQTMAWSDGIASLHAHVVQQIGTAYVDGVPCDVSHIQQADYGQHPHAGQTGSTTKDEFDMASLSDLETAIRRLFPRQGGLTDVIAKRSLRYVKANGLDSLLNHSIAQGNKLADLQADVDELKRRVK